MNEESGSESSAKEASSLEASRREKSAAALGSVAAAVCLTAMKIVVGLITGSLGILAEAAHSGLDLVAAALTLVAVRLSSRPADRTHTYGHGKVENFSAMIETALLLLTCVWIVYEAVRRLFVRHVEVEASFWAFAVMAVSIGVDISRARMLNRMARKHHSQALEADALHFSTDIWSSAVVIAGLGFVWLAKAAGLPWLAKADAVAALGVSAIVVTVSLRLGRKTVADLLDGVPANLREEVVRAAHVRGVLEVRRVRIRRSGPEIFVDLVLIVGRHEAFERAHEISNVAKACVLRALGAPSADITVHVAPSREADEDLSSLARTTAARHGLAAHDVRVFEAGGQPALDLHLEIKEAADVAEAHARATAFEEDVRRERPGLGRIFSHLEPVAAASPAVSPAGVEAARIRRVIAEVARMMGVRCDPHEIQIEEVGGRLAVSFHCTLDPATGLGEAHALTERFEHALRAGVPRLARVLIHTEPPEAP